MSSQKSITFTIPVFDFKRIETPLDNKGYRNYVAVANVLSIPDMKSWNTSNVRDAKSKGKVPNAIRQSLLGNPLFGFMNRGIVIMADHVEYDNKSKIMSFSLHVPDVHGIGDGGHTRLIISEEVDTIKEKVENGQESPFVRLEIMVGFDLPEIRDIVGARNTSNQVKEQSLMELEKKFDDIKAVLADQRYYEDIAFKEFELYNGTDTPKPIDIMDVIAMLYMFDIRTFTGQRHPISAYSAKSQCLTHFKKDLDSGNSVFQSLYAFLPEILRLHDELYLALPDLYNEAGRIYRGESVSSGRFGKLTGVACYEDERVELPFSGRKSKYRIPSSFLYPILGAFRAFLGENNGRFAWFEGCNPFDHIRGDTGLRMANALAERVLEDANPNKTGKSPLFWSSCYTQAEIVRKSQENIVLKKLLSGRR